MVLSPWISKAIKKPDKQLSIPKDEKLPKGTLREAAKKGGTLGRRANLAITLGKTNAK